MPSLDRFITRVLASLAFLASACAQPAPHGSSTPPPPSVSASAAASGVTWLVTAEALREMDAIGSVDAVLRSATVLEIEGTTHTLAAGVPATPVQSFRNDASFEQWLSAGSYGDVKAVLYDPESWSYTPVAEQQNVATYARQFVVAARQHGLIPILAPGMDLTKVLAPGSASDASGYLQLQLPAAMGQALAGGPGYDVIQAQSLERTPQEYLTVVQAAAAQVRSQNPDAMVLAGISTNPAGGPVTEAELADDVQVTRSLVGGYWLNVPQPGSSCPGCGSSDPSLGVQLLNAVS